MPSRSRPRDDDPGRRPRPARGTGARGKRSGRRSPGPPPGPPRGLFAEVVQAPDRDHSPGARPTICLREGESAEFREQVEERLVRRARLVRRGRDHGTVVELEPEGLVPPLPKSKELRAARAWRWHAGRPVVMPGLLVDEVQRAAKRLRGALRLRERLAEPGGLAGWLRDKQADLAPEFRLGDPELACADPERDLERVGLESTGSAALRDLWAKTGRLSTFEGDASLRLRIAFGEEGTDDDSDDEERHRLVADLGQRLLPGAREVAASAPLGKLLARFTGHTPLLTQGIAYWNAPGGGALLHHDAFREEPGGQRGVVYTQLSGQTFWLALSTEDLGERVAEFADHLEQGAADWLCAELFPDEAQWQALLRLARDPELRLAELASPGCGALGPLVQRGPEFTGFLVDAGHGFFLEPGDALLLPNHGTRRTALHSVFQVGERVAYGLSLAVRDAADRAVG